MFIVQATGRTFDLHISKIKKVGEERKEAG